MSMPQFLRDELHIRNEAEEARLPYDPTIPSRMAVRDHNPWDRFEYRSVLAYTGNRERIDALRIEFGRVGLTDVVVQWNFDNLWIKSIVYDHVTMPHMHKPAIVNNAFGHYSIIKTAYELGARHCLVMEDDIRFLRDVSLLKTILTELPADYDIALLDSLHHRETTNPSTPSGNGAGIGEPVTEHWVRMRDDESATSAACYALNRNGMKALIDCYEAPVLASKPEDRVLWPSDCFFNWARINAAEKGRVKNIYIAAPKVARQTKIGNGKTNTQYDRWSQLGYAKSPRKNYGQ